VDQTIAWIVLFLLGYIALRLESERRKQELKLDALQRRVNAIAEHLNVKVQETFPPEVAGLIQAGRKIEAIKVYRQATGAGLAEAKAAVERIQAEKMDGSGKIIQT
jgi:ribosomal protein L7/L12